jgi:tetratricopeptide (TPR) repeat protein
VYATDRAGVFRFKHGIMREVVYDSVRMAERRQTHRAIAEALEGNAGGGASDAYEALAYHYRGSGDHERAASYAELAGDKAMLTSSLDRARMQYSTALAELSKLPMTLERKRRWLATSAKWAGVYVYSPSRQQLDTLGQAAVYAAELGDAGAQARTAHWRGWIHYVLGEYADAIAHIRDGLELAQRQGDERMLAQLWTSLGQCHAAAGEYGDALESLTRGLQLKRAAVHGRRGSVVAQGFAYAIGCKAVMHADCGDFELAETDIAEALEAVSGSGHAIEGSVLGLQCMIAIYRGDWAACAETARRSGKVAERVHSAYVFSMAAAFDALARFHVDASTSALVEMRRAVEWLDTRDTGLFSSFNYGCLAEALACAGSPDAAREYAQRALQRKQCRDPLGETMAHRALARIADARALASEHVRAALDSARARGSRRDVAVTELLAAELDIDLELVQPAAASALAQFERMGMRWYSDQARRVLGAH